MFGTERTNFEISHQGTNRWRPRDNLAAALLFVATAAFVIWQNSRAAALWDLGYLLDTSWRIALGQLPYRDFPLAHAPLTFLIQSVLIRLGGRHYFIQIAYAAIAGGLATILTWRILLRVASNSTAFGRATWLIAFVMAAPLTCLGIYSIYPHPIYDCDCALAVLLAILLLVRADSREISLVSGHDFSRDKNAPRWTRALAPGGRSRFKFGNHIAPLAAGAATVLPLFFKQNMGLPFLAVVAVGTLVLLCMQWKRTRSVRVTLRSLSALVLTGMAAALLVGLGIIAATAGLSNYFHWTVQFAAQRRMPGLASMLAVYNQPSFAWTLPTFAAGLTLCRIRIITHLWPRIAAFCLIAAPFAGSLVFLPINDDVADRADNLLALFPLLLLAALVVALLQLRRGITLGRLIPLFILAAMHGTLLSQQLWGSTYALWPLLMVLAAFVLGSTPSPARPVAIAAAAAIAAAFLICGGLYSVSLERLSYIQIPDGPAQHSSISALRGLATPGPFLSNLDELVEFTRREIPQNDALLPLPGEDPFFYATGRAPQFPVTLFDPATDPYSASELMDEVRRRNVRWVIVKRLLQINENPMPDRDQTIDMVQREFVLYRRLRGYDVFRR